MIKQNIINAMKNECDDNAEIMAMVDRALSKCFKGSEVISLKDIREMYKDACDLFGLNPEVKTRKTEYVYAKNIIAYYVLHHYGCSLNYVARSIGWKDHTSAINARRTAQNLIDSNDYLFTSMYNRFINLIEKKHG